MNENNPVAERRTDTVQKRSCWGLEAQDVMPGISQLLEIGQGLHIPSPFLKKPGQPPAAWLEQKSPKTCDLALERQDLEEYPRTTHQLYFPGSIFCSH